MSVTSPPASTSKFWDRSNSPSPTTAASPSASLAAPGLGLVLVTVAALGLIAYLFTRDPSRPGMWLACGLVAGGALGNLADRIVAGEVTDYIAVGSWPPFNVADIAITCGVALLALIYIRDAESDSESEAEGG